MLDQRTPWPDTPSRGAPFQHLGFRPGKAFAHGRIDSFAYIEYHLLQLGWTGEGLEVGDHLFDMRDLAERNTAAFQVLVALRASCVFGARKQLKVDLYG
ncbi:hypothetical protein [Thauera mechernichensis]